MTQDSGMDMSTDSQGDGMGTSQEAGPSSSNGSFTNPMSDDIVHLPGMPPLSGPPASASGSSSSQTAANAARYRPRTTAAAYGHKQEEFQQWCIAQGFSGEPPTTATTVTQDKLFNFLNNCVFDRSRRNDPTKKVGRPTVSAYISAMVDLWKRQASEGTNPYPNPHGPAIKMLVKSVPFETEKTDGTPAPKRRRRTTFGTPSTPTTPAPYTPTSSSFSLPGGTPTPELNSFTPMSSGSSTFAPVPGSTPAAPPSTFTLPPGSSYTAAAPPTTFTLPPGSSHTLATASASRPASAPAPMRPVATADPLPLDITSLLTLILRTTTAQSERNERMWRQIEDQQERLLTLQQTLTDQVGQIMQIFAGGLQFKFNGVTIAPPPTSTPTVAPVPTTTVSTPAAKRKAAPVPTPRVTTNLSATPAPGVGTSASFEKTTAAAPTTPVSKNTASVVPKHSASTAHSTSGATPSTPTPSSAGTSFTQRLIASVNAARTSTANATDTASRAIPSTPTPSTDGISATQRLIASVNAKKNLSTNVTATAPTTTATNGVTYSSELTSALVDLMTKIGQQSQARTSSAIPMPNATGTSSGTQPAILTTTHAPTVTTVAPAAVTNGAQVSTIPPVSTTVTTGAAQQPAFTPAGTPVVTTSTQPAGTSVVTTTTQPTSTTIPTSSSLTSSAQANPNSNPPQHYMSRAVTTIPELWKEWTVGIPSISQPQPLPIRDLERKWGTRWCDKSERFYFKRRYVVIMEIVRRLEAIGAYTYHPDQASLQRVFKEMEEQWPGKSLEWLGKNIPFADATAMELDMGPTSQNNLEDRQSNLDGSQPPTRFTPISS